jgi:hypothetical protein
MTSGQQEFLANICTVIGRALRDAATPHGANPVTTFEDILEECDRFDITPAKLGTLYDKLHRTGSNS